MEQHPETRAAVLVDSAVGRAAVTPLGWLYGTFTAFRRSDLDQAFAFLEIGGPDRALARSELARHVASVRAR